VRCTVALGDQATSYGGQRGPRSALHRALDVLGHTAIAWRLRFYDPRVLPGGSLVVALHRAVCSTGIHATPPGH